MLSLRACEAVSYQSQSPGLPRYARNDEVFVQGRVRYQTGYGGLSMNRLVIA